MKIFLDALNGVAYKDDAEVWITCCAKFYGEEHSLEITMREVDD